MFGVVFVDAPHGVLDTQAFAAGPDWFLCLGVDSYDVEDRLDDIKGLLKLNALIDSLLALLDVVGIAEAFYFVGDAYYADLRIAPQAQKMWAI